MVKGVNKTVIVVNDTGSEMFEKIVFYVTPKYSKTSIKELNKTVGELSLSFSNVNKSKITLRKRRLRRKILLITAVSFFSIALFTLIMTLIF